MIATKNIVIFFRIIFTDRLAFSLNHLYLLKLQLMLSTKEKNDFIKVIFQFMLPAFE